MGHNPIEVAKTVLEVADVAWSAVEHCHHHHEHNAAAEDHHDSASDVELEGLRSENWRLRKLLEENLKLLQNLSESPCLLQDCPPDWVGQVDFHDDPMYKANVEDECHVNVMIRHSSRAFLPQLHDHLVDTVESEKFLTKLKFLQDESANGIGSEFPFKEASGVDLQSAEVLINVDQEEPSWWVWVTDNMDPSDVEEPSGIDNENYLVVTEEHVVYGVATFMARCVLSNPKAMALTPQQLQKTLHKALDGMNKVEKMVHVWHAGKMFYALSTWGLAIAGLYRTRAVLKVAAMGIHTTSKVVLKAL